MRFSIHLLQLIEQVDRWDAWAMFNLDGIDFNWETRWIEFFDSHADHIQSMLWRRQILFIWSRTTRDEPDLIDIEQVDYLGANLQMWNGRWVKAASEHGNALDWGWLRLLLLRDLILSWSVNLRYLLVVLIFGHLKNDFWNLFYNDKKTYG